MKLFKKIKNLESKFAWSFLGFLLALFFGAITIYLGFLKKDVPDLNYIIIANSSVLDVKENIGSLEVFYENESLSKLKKDLRFITFKVVNQGNAPILPNYYDLNDPIGFKIIDGVIADQPTLLEASNKYLKEKLIVKKNSNNIVVFSNVILEPNEYFEIKVLILHDIDKTPHIESFGKVALVNAIKILTDYSSQDKPSFIEVLFGGGLVSNILRLIIYGMVFLFMIIGIIGVSEKISRMKKRKHRVNLLKIFKEYDSEKITKKDEFFFDHYLNKGSNAVKEFHSILSSKDKIKKLYYKDQGSPSSEEITESVSFYCHWDNINIYRQLKSEGFITVEDGEVEVDEQRLIVLTNFFNYLKRKGEFKNSQSLEDVLNKEMIQEQTKSIDCKNESE